MLDFITSPTSSLSMGVGDFNLLVKNDKEER